MSGNEGMAFARLFSQRRGELDLSIIDIAAQTGRPIEVVVAWDRGDAVPDPDDIPMVADILRLPKPLLTEALRRVGVHRQDTAHPEPIPIDTSSSSPAGQSIPQEPAPDDPLEKTVRDRTTLVNRIVGVAWDSLGNLFNELRQTMGRRRRAARVRTTMDSYTEDPEQVVTYRLRMVFTVTGVIVLALILRWSLTGLGAAVTDLWTALTGAL